VSKRKLFFLWLPLVKISLWRRHAIVVEDGGSRHKIDYVTIFQENLNLKRQPNRITGSKVSAILLKGGSLPIGGVTSGRVCWQLAKQACLVHLPSTGV
jgi:hypothetical protein